MGKQKTVAGNELYSSNVSLKLSGIRIARVSTVPFTVVALLKYQIEMLGKYGAKVSVITSNEPELVLLGGLEGITCVPVDIPRSIAPWRDLKALISLYLFFRREHIQIAHSTTPKAGLLMALAAFFAGVPVRLHTFTGQPWIIMHGAKKWLLRSSDKLIGMLNTRCYADSESQRNFLISQGVVDARRLFVIGSGSLAGVDVQRFDRSRFSNSQCESLRRTLKILDDEPILLFVGRITVDKGIRELLQAYQIIKAVASTTHLVLVGNLDAESGVGGGILIEDIEHISGAHFAGYTETPERYMAVADILCLPSYREGFGTVVIEAAAMGVPTVATNIYGLSDAVINGETGLLVAPRDAVALAGALEKLLADKTMRTRLGAAAQQRARKLFDAEDVTKQVVDEYCALLKARQILQ